MPRDAQLTTAERHTLNLQAHRLLGLPVFTYEEMHAEAKAVWRQQPEVRSFLMGFRCSWTPHEDTRRWEFTQAVPDYSGDEHAAATLLRAINGDNQPPRYRILLVSQPRMHGCWTCEIEDTQRDNREVGQAYGATIPLATTRAFIRFRGEPVEV